MLNDNYKDKPFYVYTRPFTDLEGNELDEIVIQSLSQSEMIIHTNEFKEWKKLNFETSEKNKVFFDDESQLAAKFKRKQTYQNKTMTFDLPQKISRKKKKELNQSFKFESSPLFDDD